MQKVTIADRTKVGGRGEYARWDRAYSTNNNKKERQWRKKTGESILVEGNGMNGCYLGRRACVGWGECRKKSSTPVHTSVGRDLHPLFLYQELVHA